MFSFLLPSFFVFAPRPVYHLPSLYLANVPKVSKKLQHKRAERTANSAKMISSFSQVFFYLFLGHISQSQLFQRHPFFPIISLIQN